MHKLDNVKYIILIIGLFLLFIASTLYYQSQHPFKDSIETIGHISQVPLIEKGKATQGYKVRFKTLSKQTLTLSIKPQIPLVLEQPVSLIYNQAQPSQLILKQPPKLTSHISIWANVGSLLILLFLAVHLKDFKKQHKIRRLQNKGIEIKTRLRSVELDQELEAKGKRSYRICTEWLNPNATALHLFKSDYLLFDPSDLLEDSEVTVIIEKDNPSEYHLDLSFLNTDKKEPGFKW